MRIGSIADWAKEQRISRVAAYKRIKNHGITVSRGRLDLDEANRIWQASLNPAKVRGGVAGGSNNREDYNPPSPDDPADPPVPGMRSTMGKLQIQREALRIRRERLVIDALEGKSVSLADVRAWEAQVFTNVKSTLVVIGAELRDDLAVSTDPVECQAMIDRRINAALASLAGYKPEIK